VWHLLPQLLRGLLLQGQWRLPLMQHPVLQAPSSGQRVFGENCIAEDVEKITTTKTI